MLINLSATPVTNLYLYVHHAVHFQIEQLTVPLVRRDTTGTNLTALLAKTRTQVALNAETMDTALYAKQGIIWTPEYASVVEVIVSHARTKQNVKAVNKDICIITKQTVVILVE
jgi:hypothetical protein